MALMGGLVLHLPVSQAQSESLQLPLQTATSKLHSGGPTFGGVQCVPQTLPLRLHPCFGRTLLIQLILYNFGQTAGQ